MGILARVRPARGVDDPAGLRPSISWVGALVLAAGSALQITVILGPMAADVGNVQIWVWALAALVGVVQCVLIAELATFYPHRAGGTATYAHEAFGGGAPTLSALSSWGYWFAWTPGIAVNLILAAEYLQASIAPGLNTFAFCVVVGGTLYLANGLGLGTAVKISIGLAVMAGIPLLLLIFAPLNDPSLFHLDRVWPVQLPAGTSADTGVSLVVKWLFVATWSAYGAEIASTVIAEVRRPATRAFRALAVSGALCVLTFTAVPFVMTGIVGTEALTGSPTSVFLVPARALFGSLGASVVAVMLSSALVLGAQAYIVASSRTVYQMSKDGHLPRFLSTVGRRGTPTRSVLFDVAVISLLMAMFGTNLVDVVAVANIGYLVVFVIMPLAFAAVRLHRRHHGQTLVLAPVWTWVALVIALFNAVLLVVGGALWGPRIWLTGLLITLAIVPFSMIRRRLMRPAVTRPAMVPADGAETAQIGAP